MSIAETMHAYTQDELIAQLASQLRVEGDTLCLFAESTEFLFEILSQFGEHRDTLFVVGHTPPDLAIAADRARLEVTETLGRSPFVGDIECLTELPFDTADLIYMANPHTVTGTSYSLADIEFLANANPDGMLIIDEQYHDYYGISAHQLVDSYANIIILRSFASSFGIISAGCGYAIASESIRHQISGPAHTSGLSTATRKIISTSLSNEEALAQRLRMIHDESMRVSTALTRLGIQTRITSTDFILLRVADTAAVGNILARHRVSVDNLDGYPELKHYLRYRIQSPASNDEFIRAFSRMRPACYRLDTLDARITTLRKGPERFAPGTLPGRGGVEPTASRVKRRMETSKD